MQNQEKYHIGLLYLAYLLISADGVIDEREQIALLKIKSDENIPDQRFDEFRHQVAKLKEREIYQHGIKIMDECTDEEKLKAFVHLYKMSEADGRVHVKEVRLLLYSIRQVGIEFDDVIQRATQLNSKNG
jgi:uncharacterized tellurite resistance protein B-like protein